MMMPIKGRGNCNSFSESTKSCFSMLKFERVIQQMEFRRPTDNSSFWIVLLLFGVCLILGNTRKILWRKSLHSCVENFKYEETTRKRQRFWMKLPRTHQFFSRAAVGSVGSLNQCAPFSSDECSPPPSP